jgi:hypothetical protein
VIANQVFADTIFGGLVAFAQGLAKPPTLLSLAMGFSAIFIVSLMPLRLVPVQVRTERS